MLRVVVYFTIENGMSNAFINAIEKAQIVQQGRKEQGNIQYDFFQSLSCVNLVLLMQCWNTEEDYRRYMESGYKQLFEIERGFVVAVKIEKYVK